MRKHIVGSAEALGRQIAGAKKTTHVALQKNEQAFSKPVIVKSSSTPQKSPYAYFQIKPFKDNEQGVGHWDNILHNFASLGSKSITFVMHGNNDDIKMYAVIPSNFINYFQNTFYTNYPTSELTPIQNLPTQGKKSYLAYDEKGILLSKTSFTKDGSYLDPMSDILSLYGNVYKDSSLSVFFCITYRQEPTFRQEFFGKLKKFFSRSRGAKKEEAPAEEKKVLDTDPIKDLKPELYMSIAYTIHSNDAYTKEHLEENVVSVFSPFIKEGGVKKKTEESFTPMMYSHAVNFFHIPTKINYVKGLDYLVYRKLSYPNNLSTPDNSVKNELTLLGTTDYRADKITFGIRREDKFRHLYVLGKTGTGKSTFISNLIKSDMMAGNGLCLLDPHGDLVETVMEHIPTNRINDVILFDVADTDFPIGFNLLQYKTEDEKIRIVSGVVSAFYKLFANSWGPRLEYILRNVLLSVVEYPNATLMHILRVLIDKNFRDEVVSHIKDAMVLKFRESEFNKRTDKQREEAVGPITNKVGQFLSSSIVRNIFGQPRTKLNIRQAMDEGKIILVNLSKGKIGEDNAAMIGSLLVTKFQIDAMSRADTPMHLRRDFYLYIDEFQNFATGSFAVILSEARKYKLSLIVANQYTSQLLPEIKDAIFGNIGTIISFTIGYEDAVFMSSQFKEMVSTNDLISLPRFTAYTRLMIDGITSDPFSMKTMPLSSPEGSAQLMEKIKKQSRQRYSIERIELEKLMDARNRKTFSAQEKVMEKAQMESLGISDAEIEIMNDLDMLKYAGLFRQYIINEIQADAMIVDMQYGMHKVLRYTQPEKLEEVASKKLQKGQTFQTPQGASFPIHVDIWQHNTITDQNNTPLMIWIGSRADTYAQLQDTYANAPHLKLLINKAKIDEEKKAGAATTNATTTSSSSGSTNSYVPKNTSDGKPFSIKDIVVGQEYDGYVKLAYNYGIFVTVKGVEGLLHKNYIKDLPGDVERKKYYNTGDKIKVKALEIKDIKGEMRVVWSQ